MTESMGQRAIVENKPGAGGVVASETVAKCAPHRYTPHFLSNGKRVSEPLFNSMPSMDLRVVPCKQTPDVVAAMNELREPPVSDSAKWKAVIENAGSTLQ